MSWVGFSIVHGQEGQSNGTAQAGTKNKGLNFSLCPRKRGAAAMEASHSSVTQGCRGVCLRPGLNHGHTKPWGKGEINRVCPNWHKAAVSVLITQRGMRQGHKWWILISSGCSFVLLSQGMTQVLCSSDHSHWRVWIPLSA